MAAERTCPIWEKACLTIDEAAVYSNIGTDRLRAKTKERDCDFIIHVGTKTLIHRKRFLEYLDRISVF